MYHEICYIWRQAAHCDALCSLAPPKHSGGAYNALANSL